MKIIIIMLALTMIFASGFASAVHARENVPEWRPSPPFTPGPQEPDAPPEPVVPADPDVPPGPGVPGWVIEWMEGWRRLPWGPVGPPWRFEEDENDSDE